MDTVPNNDIVTAAITALAAFHPTDAEQVENMLLFWVRRHEMTAGDLAEIQNRMFPLDQVSSDGSPEKVAGARIDVADVRELARRVAAAGFAINPDGDPSYLVERINELLAEGVTPTPPESEWVEFPARCAAWCTGKHVTDGQFRDCESEEMFVPRHGDRVVCVNIGTTFNRATGIGTPALVRLEDYSFTPQYARHLAQLLVRAADLLDG